MLLLVLILVEEVSKCFLQANCFGGLGISGNFGVVVVCNLF